MTAWLFFTVSETYTIWCSGPLAFDVVRSRYIDMSVMPAFSSNAVAVGVDLYFLLSRAHLITRPNRVAINGNCVGVVVTQQVGISDLFTCRQLPADVLGTTVANS